jgi:FAD/FMN-containing dehydrogenase
VLQHNEVIARGNGRCYGDAALGEAIFSTTKLNKFISFDRLNGVIECESGVLLSEILEVTVPQGYFWELLRVLSLFLWRSYCF